MPLTNPLKEPHFLETLVTNAGMLGLVGVIALVIILVFKIEKMKELAAELARLKRAFDELDGQAKLIVQTDLELHRAQEELDKKVSGLVTLQKLTRLISTTLDKDEIFGKIEEKHITEIGFDRGIVFSRNEDDAYVIRFAGGYKREEADRILAEVLRHPLFVDTVLRKNRVFSSLDTDRAAKDIPALLKLFDISSFICAPITQKEGAIGALILGCESPYTHLTEGDKDLVFILATQLGQALENAKLFEETWRSHQELEHKIQQRTRELSEALEEIKTISKRKSDFISAVSHELRTPLTSIKGYASILSAGKLGELPPPAKERVEKINKHSDNLSQLINNLLDISRIESGRVELALEPLNLKAMLDGLADMFAPSMKEKNITFNVDIPSGLPAAQGDRTQIERVFINLIGNAVKFVPQGGEIAVRAKEQDAGTIAVFVTDSGIGIPEKDLAKLGEEFFRIDNDVNAKVKGTGLGLSLVKSIIAAHKGRLHIASQLGKGSTFTFTLPKA